MKPIDATFAIEAVAVLLVSAGVWIWLGPGPAMVTAGGLVLLASVGGWMIGRRRDNGNR